MMNNAPMALRGRRGNLIVGSQNMQENQTIPEAIELIRGLIDSGRIDSAAQLIMTTEGVEESCEGGEGSLLFEVTKAAQPRLCKLLIERGANVHARNSFGDTPLHYAAYHATPEVCEVLLQAGANVHAIGHGNNTPLHHAAATGSIELVECLVAAGGDLNYVPSEPPDGWHTPFLGAVKDGYPWILARTLPYMVNVLGQSLQQTGPTGLPLDELTGYPQVKQMIRAMMTAGVVAGGLDEALGSVGGADVAPARKLRDLRI
jgi:hypothetical protein